MEEIAADTVAMAVSTRANSAYIIAIGCDMRADAIDAAEIAVDTQEIAVGSRVGAVDTQETATESSVTPCNGKESVAFPGENRPLLAATLRGSRFVRTVGSTAIPKRSR